MPPPQDQSATSVLPQNNAAQTDGALNALQQQQQWQQQPPSPSTLGFPQLQQQQLQPQLQPGQQPPYHPPASPQQVIPGQQSPFPAPPSPNLAPQFQGQPNQLYNNGMMMGMPPQMGQGMNIGMPLQPQLNNVMMGGPGGQFPQQGMGTQLQPGQQQWAQQQPFSNNMNMDPNQMQQQMAMMGQQQQWPGQQQLGMMQNPQFFSQQQPQQGGVWPQMQQMQNPQMMQNMMMLGQQQPQQQQWQPQTGGYVPPSNIASSHPSACSLGYVDIPQIPSIYPPSSATRDMDIILKAFKSSNTDEKALISVLAGANINPLHLSSIRQAYRAANPIGKEIVEVANNKTLNFNGGFKYAVTGILYGPVSLDAYLLERSLGGLGTVEKILDLVLLSRSNADMVAIKNEYAKMYKKDLNKSIKSDLSGDVMNLFLTALEARREYEDVNTPTQIGSFNWQQFVEHDCKELYTAMVGSAEGNRVSNIFVTRSDVRLKAIAEGYTQYTASTDPLEKMIKKKFRGHMEDALLYILNGAIDRVKRDASGIHDAFNSSKIGKFDKDEQLAVRIVKLAWEECAKPGYMVEVKEAYNKHYATQTSGGKRVKLVDEVKSRTKSDFEKILLKLLKAEEHANLGV